MADERVEFIVPIDNFEDRDSLPIPPQLDASIGHLTNVTLKRRDLKKEWSCVLSKVEKENSSLPSLSLEGGWSHVYNDNGIGQRNLVAFLFVGNDTFIFHVYDHQLIIRPLPIHLRNAPEEIEARVMLQRGRPPKWKRSGPHAELAQHYLATCKKDAFIAETKLRYSEVRSLTLPNPFVKRCIPYGRFDRATTKLIDSGGDEWRMILSLNKKIGGELRNCRLTDRFFQFARAHELPKNTLLVLELLTDKASFKFNITAFKN